MGLDAIRGRQEFLPLYLEENLGSRRVEGCCRGSRPAEVRPLYPPPRRLRGRPPGLFCSWVLLLLAFFDNQGLNRDEMVCPLHHLQHRGRGFFHQASNLKLVGIGLSHISRAKGEPRLELSPASSFDLATSFCTSSNCLFTHRSCTWSELVESDDNISGSCVVCSTSRYGMINFSRTIERALDRVSSRSYVVGPGWTSIKCSREPP
ncbi:hypothetical protein BHE74_00022858 [Ensete ventricosum]|nr:hypothetical protein BHE74_00022858 [Ensete ventricosum]